MEKLLIFAITLAGIVIAFKFLTESGLLQKLFGDSERSKIQKLPYKKKDYLLTVAEKNFYWILSGVAEKNNSLLFAKVRLEDLLWLPRGTDNRFGLRNRIKSRHIDFVLCDKENIKPLIAIELDDSSHNREDRIERDFSIDNILRDAGLPILHQRVQPSYYPQEVEDKIYSLLKPNS